MAQEIKIGVNANAAGAEAAIGDIEKAARGAEGAVSGLAQTSQDVAAGMAAAARATEKANQALSALRETRRKLLSDMTGKPIDDADLGLAMANWDKLRRNNPSRVVRKSATLEEWAANLPTAFNTDAGREEHRAKILGHVMHGTRAARPVYGPEQRPAQQQQQPNNFPPPPPPDPGAGVKRAQSMAMGFGKSMLALAGIGGVMGMAASAVDMHTEESVGEDTLKRRAGDLGVEFGKLQQQVRQAGDGMGMTYVETVRLARIWSEVSGKLDMQGVRTGTGMSRAFGMDPAAGVQFLATMQRIKAPGTDSQGDRRLALMIGESVAKSGYTGKVEDVLNAISGLASEMTRNSLSSPNIGAIAGYLTTLTKSGIPGLDPNGAAALLGTADNAVRRGGGMGDASKNFMYGALSRSNPGMNVYQAGALWEGGIFGTTNSVFHGKDSAIAKWAAENGADTPGGDDTTNLSKMMKLLRQRYGKNQWGRLDAIKNTLGLTAGQAAGLDMMDAHGPTNLKESQDLISRAGLSMDKLSGTGMFNVGRIAAAKNRGELGDIYKSTMGRGDISGAEKDKLTKAMQGGTVDALKVALTQVLGTHDQEKTEGSETRESIASLKNELTRVGGALLEVLNPIRETVVAIAEGVAPQSWKTEHQRLKEGGIDFGKRVRGEFGAPRIKAELDDIAKRYAAAGGGYDAADKVAPYPSGTVNNPARDMAAFRNKVARRMAGAQAIKFTPEQLAELAKIKDPKERAYIEGLLRTENAGFGAVRDAVSKKGAQGYGQFMDATWNGAKDAKGVFHPGVGGGLNIHNFGDNVTAMRRMYKEGSKLYHGDLRAMAAHYNGGGRMGKMVASGKDPSFDETLGYMPVMEAAGGFSGGKSKDVTVHIAGGTIEMPVVQGGKKVAVAKVAFASAPAAGVPHK